MTQRLETLRQKYDRYISAGNHVKALQTMQQIARLSAANTPALPTSYSPVS